MSVANILLSLLCALGISGGQLLMKGASVAWNQAGTLLSPPVLGWIGCAFALYSCASFGWMYVLRVLPLSIAYPLLATTFFLVPLGGFIFFNERLSWIDGAASLLIMSGICVTALGRASQG